MRILTCDFCSEMTPEGESKPYEPLQRVTEVRASWAVARVNDIGPWWACKVCARLIDNDLWQELANRALAPLLKLAPDVPYKFHIEAVRSMWEPVFGKERMKL